MPSRPAKEITREELNAAVARYLRRGGTITKVEPPEVTTEQLNRRSNTLPTWIEYHVNLTYVSKTTFLQQASRSRNHIE